MQPGADGAPVGSIPGPAKRSVPPPAPLQPERPASVPEPVVETTDVDAESATDDAASERASRTQRAVESVKLRATSIRDDLERRRADIPVIDVVFRSAEHDARTGGGILAGAVAFRAFLFVVPYVFFVVFVPERS